MITSNATHNRGETASVEDWQAQQYSAQLVARLGTDLKKLYQLLAVRHRIVRVIMYVAKKLQWFAWSWLHGKCVRGWTRIPTWITSPSVFFLNVPVHSRPSRRDILSSDLFPVFPSKLFCPTHTLHRAWYAFVDRERAKTTPIEENTCLVSFF